MQLFLWWQIYIQYSDYTVSAPKIMILIVYFIYLGSKQSSTVGHGEE